MCTGRRPGSIVISVIGHSIHFVVHTVSWFAYKAKYVSYMKSSYEY